MPYAVRAFFENGGTECYVVRITRHSGPSGTEPRTAGFMVPSGWLIKGQSTLTANASTASNILAISGDLPPVGAIVRFAGTDELAEIQDSAPGTITLAAPPSQDYASGSTLDWLEGTRLSAAATRSASQVQVKSPLAVSDHSLITITGGGVLNPSSYGSRAASRSTSVVFSRRTFRRTHSSSCMAAGCGWRPPLPGAGAIACACN